MPNSAHRCPMCRKPAEEEFKPFCSRGCRDRDLLKWLGEDYCVPVSRTRDDDSAPREYGVDSEG